MSNYTQITNFTAKDSLASGNAAKKVKGVDFDGEFAAISTAITSKADKTAATFTGTVDLADSVRLRFGAGSDLQIYHDGFNSYIADTGTGNLTITGNSSLRLRQAVTGLDSDLYVDCTGGGSVDVYYNNAKKLETTAGGVTVTGELIATTINGGTF